MSLAPESWTLDAIRTPSDDVEITVTTTAAGITSGTAIRLTREEARTFASGVLAAAGDGTERTFRPEVRREPARESRSDASPPSLPPEPPADRSTARLSGYTGDLCPTCQSDKMKRTGHCVTCENCGNNDGCS